MSCLCLLLGLLGQEYGLNVGQNASLSDSHARQQFVQLLVVSDGELQMTGNNTSLLVISGGITGQLEHLSRQVLQHSGQIDRSAGTDTLCEVAYKYNTSSV